MKGTVEINSIEVLVGLDVGKGDHYATAVDRDGNELLGRSVGNEQSDIEALIDSALEIGSCALVIDQPGSIAALVLCVAVARGIPVAYIPGLVMRRASELYPGQGKTDKRDSFVLADTARMRLEQLQWLTPSAQQITELQILTGYDDDLREESTRASNRLRDLMLSVHPSLERVIGPLLDRESVLAVVERYPTPTQLAKAGKPKIKRLLVKYSSRSSDTITQQIETALKKQTLTVGSERIAGRVISELAKTLRDLKHRRGQLQEEITEIFENHPQAPILLSLPGIGPRTGAQILVEIIDINRFPTSGHLASYAGLTPVTRRSGSSIRSETRNHRGNQRLKNAFWLTAFCSLRHEPSREYYNHKIEQGKKHNAAIVCLARRRINILHAMLTKNETYRTPTNQNLAIST